MLDKNNAIGKQYNSAKFQERKTPHSVKYCIIQSSIFGRLLENTKMF